MIAWLVPKTTAEHTRMAMIRAELRRDRIRQAEIDGEAAAVHCSMRAASVVGKVLTPGQCWLCGGELPARRRRWCSETCVSLWVRNHAWTTARHFATLRARAGTSIASVEVWGLLDASDDPVWRLIRDLRERCGTKGPVEINHVVPRHGAGYGLGCHNHQTNLEPLCHPCHVAETTMQTRERLGVPPEGRPKGYYNAIRDGRDAPTEPLWGPS